MIVRGVDIVRRVLPDRWVLSVYSRPHLAGFLRRALNRFVPEGLSSVRIAGGGLQGLRMELDLRREKFLWLGTYEPWIQEAMSRYVRPGDWAWDVGGFIGYHSLFLWRLGANVVALEPDPINFDRLLTNLRANGAHDVRALRLAAGRTEGRARFRRLAEHPSQTRLEDDGDGECSVVPLDNLLANCPAPRLVKVDVEGSELDVLAGASILLRECRPVWIVETHGTAEIVAACFRLERYEVRPVGKGAEVDTQLPVGGPAHLLAVPRA
ncbi:MAG: FkbM family methyltransferase [Armatimonadota bacterium]|nr:FkbM family methyltransferase [Armatimonadota bacterium]